MNESRFVAAWVGEGGWEVLEAPENVEEGENAFKGEDITAAATAAELGTGMGLLWFS